MRSSFLFGPGGMVVSGSGMLDVGKIFSSVAGLNQWLTPGPHFEQVLSAELVLVHDERVVGHRHTHLSELHASGVHMRGTT